MTIGPLADLEPLKLHPNHRSYSLEDLKSFVDAMKNGRAAKRLNQLIEEIYIWRNVLKVHGILRKNADR